MTRSRFVCFAGILCRLATHPAVVVAVAIASGPHVVTVVRWVDYRVTGRTDVLRVDGTTRTLRTWPIFQGRLAPADEQLIAF